MLSQVEHLARQLHRRWVPKWLESFSDHENGGFHERLNHQFKPLEMPRRRLLTQCRQLSIYAHNYVCAPAFMRAVSPEYLISQFNYIHDNYFMPETGGWRFAIAMNGQGEEEVVYDLYAHAFVLFMCVWVHKATGSDQAHQTAKDVVAFIQAHFKDDVCGYKEQLDQNLKSIEQTRRQNPHMHLFESCLFAHENWPNDPEFSDMAHELKSLFTDYLWDVDAGAIAEFYSHDMQLHAEEGDFYEPGHHFEWVWLLNCYQNNFGEDHQIEGLKLKLLEFGNKFGRDTEFGGIYNAVNRQGEVVDEDKRIWPLTEALKANTIMLSDKRDRDTIKDLLRDVTHMLSSGYLHERGFWTEILNRDLSSKTDYMPGTTPYHLYFGIMEALQILKARGRSKSWRSWLIGVMYHSRQTLSDIMRIITGRHIRRSKAGQV